MLAYKLISLKNLKIVSPVIFVSKTGKLLKLENV